MALESFKKSTRNGKIGNSGIELSNTCPVINPEHGYNGVVISIRRLEEISKPIVLRLWFVQIFFP